MQRTHRGVALDTVFDGNGTRRGNSMFSQAQRQVYRVTERSVGRLHRDRANSCPDIV